MSVADVSGHFETPAHGLIAPVDASLRRRFLPPIKINWDNTHRQGLYICPFAVESLHPDLINSSSLFPFRFIIIINPIASSHSIHSIYFFLHLLVFDDMVEFEIGLATDWTPGVGGHGAVLAFS